MFCIDENDSISWAEIDITDGVLQCFSRYDELKTIAASREWTKGRVTDIWNDMLVPGPFADLKPVKMFRNRPYGLERIWEAIQRLVPSDAASEPVAPKTTCQECNGSGANDEAGPCENCDGEGYIEQPVEAKVKDMPKKKAKAKKAPKAKKAALPEVAARKTKRDDVVKLIGRKNGASIMEIMLAMGWQAHSTRGFISTLKSKHGLNIAAERIEKRGLVYKLVA